MRPKTGKASLRGNRHVHFPINSISANTFIIQINNQPVKLPQNDLSFVMNESEHQPSQTNVRFPRVNRRIRLKNVNEDQVPSTEPTSALVATQDPCKQTKLEEEHETTKVNT